IALMRMAGIEAYNISGGWNNGVSKAEGIADLTSTKNATLNYGSHSVDSEVVAAVKEYYTLATKNGKFNISNSAAKDLIANDDVYLLDVRAENDHLKQWIAGVDKNIPFGEGMAKSFTSVLPKDKRILVQCYSGQTASQTVAVLRILGYDAWNLSGGTNGWISANLPMVKATTQQFLNSKVKKYFANLQGNNNVAAATFLKDAETPKDCVIIDIRDAADYANGHVKTAINVPYGVDIAEALDKIPNDKPVYVYCYSGQTASQAMMLLRMAGKEAYNVSGGWNNGISKVSGYAAQVNKMNYVFSDATYAVDADIKAAVKSYFEGIAKETTNKKGNISAANVKAVLNDSNYQVVDLRSAADYAKGHIEGAINVPYGRGMQNLFGTLPKDKTLILQCYSGQTASQAMAGLRVMGYKAYNLSGGMNNGWLAAGNELVK
ncbi:MAG: rhodanese-like domain-containing protein, partial [Oscillospiraceae bacterium]|nr:rhodanese-like domain-containing protein [Oscillospiraceae bacterium]